MSLTSFATYGPAAVGFKFHANDWNSSDTGVAVGAGDALEFHAKSIPKPEVGWSENEGVLAGVGIRRQRIKATEIIKGSMDFNANYAGIQRLLAAVHGTEAVASSGSGYAHTLTWANSASRVGSLAWTDNYRAHDIAMCKPVGYSLAFDGGGIGVLTSEFLGKKELVDGSGSNTISTLANLTQPTQPAIRYMTLADCTIRMNAHSAGALDSSAEIYPSKLTIKGMRTLSDGRFTSRNLPYSDEPVVGSWKDLAVTMTIPIDSADTASLYAAIVAGTAQKLDISFVGTSIGGGASWKYLWEYPIVFIPSDGLPSPDLNLPSFEITCLPEIADAAPTGMAFTAPKLTITDTTSTTHLS